MGIKIMKRFFNSESGASMVEYGIALLVVAALGVGIMQAIGAETKAVVDQACAVVSDSTWLAGSTC